MSEIAFQYTRTQRRAALGSSVVLGVWGLAVGLYCGVRIADHQVAEAVGMWLTLGFVPLLVSALIVGLARGCTCMDGDGLRVRSVWRRWQCSWWEVEGIEEIMEFGRGNSISRIQITRSSGRSFKLPVPFDSHRIGTDPDFQRKLAQIREKWRAGRKASAESL